MERILTNLLMGLYIGEKMTETCICYVCESKVDEEAVKHVEIKGNVKDICNECVDSIKGLL